MTVDSTRRVPRRSRGSVLAEILVTMSASLSTAATAAAQQSGAADPRIGLKPGWMDAGVAARNMELAGSIGRAEGFYDPAQLGSILLANSDLAFAGDHLFLGNFHGFNIYDISDPTKPALRTSFVCPGGQGDLSVYGNLLFMSVEMPNGRVDCGTQGVRDTVSADRFAGVRIFDISDIGQPKQVAAVQTCRGSHTHTLVTNPRDTDNVYVYVSGTIPPRSPAELPGCSGAPPAEDPNTALFRIEIIRVPLAAPQDARVINSPRIFASATGEIEGLWRGGDHGPGTQQTSATDQCHDITAYPDLGLAAGACSGNGILLDISDPANPRRIAEVSDPNFAYWHSATFNNDGSRVIYTDEWGGGTQPRCRDTDRKEWGADAIFELEDGKLTQRGYYKLPVAQTPLENCVAHNGSIVPVPGRDIMVQAWYQGGVSVFDFTDPSNPFEIAFFDRGPLSPDQMLLGGHWSAYWYNGHIYASEIARGLDVFRLTPSEHLTQNEIEAAGLVQYDTLNAQLQQRVVWPASFVVARAYVDQLRRGNTVAADRSAALATELDRVEALPSSQRAAALTQLAGTVAQLETEARSATAPGAAADLRRLGALAQTLRDLGNTQR
jgi:hypothetical protein